MEITADFFSLWNSLGEFELPQEQPEDTSCIFAQKFSEWSSELCTKTTRQASIISINIGKLMLLDKYFEWRAIVPKNHRNRLGKLGHPCIFQVFEKAYANLKAVELSLTPPLLVAPSSPPPSPPLPQIAGIFIGELEKP